MSSLGRACLLLMIPLNLVLVVWVWLGRIVFGVGGWFLLLLAPVALVMLVCLLITTILAFTQHGRPRALTGPQATAQLLTWIGMLGFGAFLPDFGDTEDSYTSMLGQLFGNNDVTMSVSWVVAMACALLTLVGYVGLLVLLAGRRRAPVSAPAPG